MCGCVCVCGCVGVCVCGCGCGCGCGVGVGVGVGVGGGSMVHGEKERGGGDGRELSFRTAWCMRLSFSLLDLTNLTNFLMFALFLDNFYKIVQVNPIQVKTHKKKS